ncbi:MAG: hypothetical protein IJR94_01350 [Synergistaceae bacterium]|nr:hypothetical protein [Synergistaceae bacterium]
MSKAILASLGGGEPLAVVGVFYRGPACGEGVISKKNFLKGNSFASLGGGEPLAVEGVFYRGPLAARELFLKKNFWKGNPLRFTSFTTSPRGGFAVDPLVLCSTIYLYLIK